MPVCIGSDGIGRRKINSADLFVQIGLFAYAWPISSKLNSDCLRILLSFEHCDRTRFLRTVASRKIRKGAGKRSCPGDGGATVGKLLAGARYKESILAGRNRTLSGCFCNCRKSNVIPAVLSWFELEKQHFSFSKSNFYFATLS